MGGQESSLAYTNNTSFLVSPIFLFLLLRVYINVSQYMFMGFLHQKAQLLGFTTEGLLRGVCILTS
jgi:predicted membrane metal-binding protein